jgi:hypothetical protein
MAKDIIYNGDIEFLNGDLKVDTSDAQHIEHVLIAFPGNYKATPLLGVGIEDYLKAPLTPLVRQSLEREIKLHLETDGAKETFVSIDNNIANCEIQAKYD